MPDTPPTAGGIIPIAKLSGNLGTVAIVLMVVAAAAPLTTLGASVALMITLGQSVVAPVGFLMAGVAFLLFAQGFVAMTPHVAKPGAFYAYVERGLGTPAGIGAAFVAFLGYSATMIAVYGFVGVVVANTVTDYGGPEIPWWVMSGIIIVAVAFLGYRRIELSARVLGVFLIGEIAIVAVLDLVIFAQGGSDGLTGDSFTSDSLSAGIGVAVLFALFGFVGVEATAVFRDEVRDPERTIARATYWAVGIIAVFYALSSLAVIEGNGGSGAITVATEDPDNFVINTAGDYMGALGRDLTQILLASSLIAAALAFHNIATRYQYVLAREGILPRALGEAHPTFHAPSRSSLVVSIGSVVILGAFTLLGLDPLLQIYGPMGGIGITSLALLWLMTSVSVLVFFTRRLQDPEVRRARRTAAVAVFAIAALTGGLVLILKNMPLIVGGSTLLNTMMAATPFVIFLVGLGLARFKNPASLESVEDPETADTL